MDNKESLERKTIVWIIVVGLLAGLVILWLIPLENRDLKFVFRTMNKNYSFEKSHDDISQSPEITFNFDSIPEEIIINKLLIYNGRGLLKVADIRFDKLYSYIDDTKRDHIVYGDGELYGISNEDGIFYLSMNQDFSGFCKILSETRLQERILLYGIYVCIFVLLCIMLIDRLTDKYENNRDNHGFVFEISRFFMDMKKYQKFMVYAAKTDLKAEVANSYLNRLWWLLEPFFSMMVYVIVFGKIMGSSVENYATFVFSALLMWNLFSKTINYSVKLVRNNRDIVTKVYVPKFVLLFSNMILNLYKLVFSAIVLLVMMIFFKVHIGVHIFWVIPSYVVMILFSFGAGMVLLHFGVYIDDLGYAVGILLNMMMFLSGTFYDIMSGLASPLNALMLCLNPVALCTDTMRNSLLYNEVENLPILIVWGLASLILCWIGVHIVYKNENSYVKIV